MPGQGRNYEQFTLRAEVQRRKLNQRAERRFRQIARADGQPGISGRGMRYAKTPACRLVSARK